MPVQGFGDNRRLHIMCKADEHTSQSVSSRAKQIWKWCQAEGGDMWNISQGEVAATLQENGQIPPDLQQMIIKR